MARQRGDAWVGDKLIDGARSRKTFATKVEAEAYEQQAVLNARDLSIGKLWPEWAERLWSKTKNERCAIGNANLIAQWIGTGVLVTDVNMAVVDALVERMEGEDYAPATINKKLACLSKLLKHGRDKEFIVAVPKIPFIKVDSGRIIVLSFEQEDALFALLPEEYRAFANFCLYTGARYSEAQALWWEDAELTNNIPQVSFWRTKTNKPRTIPLVGEALEALRKNRQLGLSQPFAHIEYWSFSRAWHKARVACGLPETYVPYVMRHTCATRLAKSGKMTELRLMKWMGHSNLMMTRRYIHLDTSDLVEGAQGLARGPRLVAGV